MKGLTLCSPPNCHVWKVALFRLYSIIEDAGIAFELLAPSHFEDLALMLLADCESVPAVLLRPMVEDDELKAWIGRVADAFALHRLREAVRTIESELRSA